MEASFKKLLVIAFAIFSTTFMALFLSVGIYGTAYFYHRPQVYHDVPIYFKFKRSCIQDHKLYEQGKLKSLHYRRESECFPTADVLIKDSKTSLMDEGIRYTVILKMKLPESTTNLDMGMFMVNMNVDGKEKDLKETDSSYWTSIKQKHHGKKTETRSFHASTATSMRFRSQQMTLLRKLAFWPLYLFEVLDEAQELDVVLFKDLRLDPLGLNWTAEVTIDNPTIQIYQSNLVVSASFTGLQHLYFTWPLLSFFLGTFLIFTLLLPILAVSVYFAWVRLATVAPSRRVEGTEKEEENEDSNYGDVTMADFCHDRLNQSEQPAVSAGAASSVDTTQKAKSESKLMKELEKTSHKREEDRRNMSSASSTSSSSIEMIDSNHSNFHHVTPDDEHRSVTSLTTTSYSDLVANISASHSSNDQSQQRDDDDVDDDVTKPGDDDDEQQGLRKRTVASSSSTSS